MGIGNVSNKRTLLNRLISHIKLKKKKQKPELKPKLNASIRLILLL